MDLLRRPGKPGSLDGQMLIAMPSMPDERFARTVIYLCAHSDDGAMGIVLNKRARHIAMPELLVQLEIIAKDNAIRLPQKARDVAVLAGGPVETTRGFVLHSTDMIIENSTLPMGENIGLTITLDMLRAIARGNGPEQAVLALGYASWGPGQLESELQSNSWLHGPMAHDLIFDPDLDLKYDKALKVLGIDPAFLSAEAGHG